jgi:hypothetical protein
MAASLERLIGLARLGELNDETLATAIKRTTLSSQQYAIVLRALIDLDRSWDAAPLSSSASTTGAMLTEAARRRRWDDFATIYMLEWGFVLALNPWLIRGAVKESGLTVKSGPDFWLLIPALERAWERLDHDGLGISVPEAPSVPQVLELIGLGYAEDDFKELEDREIWWAEDDDYYELGASLSAELLDWISGGVTMVRHLTPIERRQVEDSHFILADRNLEILEERDREEISEATLQTLARQQVVEPQLELFNAILLPPQMGLWAGDSIEGQELRYRWRVTSD